MKLSSTCFNLILLFLMLVGCAKSNSTGAGTSPETSLGQSLGPGLGTPSPSTSATPGDPCTDTQVASLHELCLLVNIERAKVGAAPLVLTSGISSVAQAHADDMATHQYFSHTGLDGRSPFDRLRDAGINFGAAGENIAWGATTATQVMNLWMNSAGHRANILNGSFRKLGLGVSQTYWVQNFTD